jgi:hypothetical protein
MLHSCTLSSYAYDACFSSVEMSYQYIKDIEIIRYLQSAVRSGPCMSVIRKITANTERLNCFNGNPKERAEILMIDANSMYPTCLQGKLGFERYEWLTENEVNNFNVMNVDPEGEWGYMLTVCFDYPESIHDRDIMLPLAVTKRAIQSNELSQFQIKHLSNLMEGIPEILSKEKLILDVHNKQEYTAYISAIPYYVTKGLQITKIHRGIKFRQSNILNQFFAKVKT